MWGVSSHRNKSDSVEGWDVQWSSSQTFPITMKLLQSDCTTAQRRTRDMTSAIYHKTNYSGGLPSEGKYNTPVECSSVWNILPLSSLLSHPLVSIQLHCLPSSSSTTKAKSHPSGVGVQPHLPTSEFVCVDELWTYSAGMFFCGDYKGLYSDWEASTKLSHSDFFVSDEPSGGGSLHSKHPDLSTTHLPPNCKPASPSGPYGILTQSNKKAWTQTQGFYCWNMSGICISHSVSFCVYFLFFGIILLRIHIFLSSRGLQCWGEGRDASHVVVFACKITSFFDVFRNSPRSPSDSARAERPCWLYSCPCLSVISRHLLCLRKCVVDS